MKLPWSKSDANAEISKFWEWFASVTAEFDATKPQDQRELKKRLERIDPGLTWGASIGKGELVSTLEVSPNGIKSLIDVTNLTVSKAPEIPGWRVVAFRQPKPFITIQAGKEEVSADTVFWTEVGGSDGKTDLDLYIPFPDPQAKEPLAKLGFLVLDHVVGEFVVMTKLGQLKFLHYSLAPAGARPLKELADHLANR